MHITMILSTSLPPKEGIGFYCTNLARELVGLGHQVTLVTRGGAKIRYEDNQDGYKIIYAPFLPIFPFHVHLHKLMSRKTIKELESKTDIFHLHSPLVATLKTKKPMICTIHSPIGFDINHSDVLNLHSLLSYLQMPISIYLENQVFKDVSIITTVSEWISNFLQNSPKYSIENKKIFTMGNGYDESLFAPTDQKKPVFPYILYVGRLTIGKGVPDLLKAYKKVTMEDKEVKLFVVGDGPLRKELEFETEELSLSNKVQFLGNIPANRRTELVSLYQNAKVFVQPSYHEGLSTSLIEAMACGTPIVTTDATGCTELIDGVTNGLKVGIGEYEKLAESILELLANEERAASFGNMARQKVRANFTWSAIAKRYENVYKEAIS